MNKTADSSKGISGNLSSIGSDTLANLMTLWTETFKRNYPSVNIQVQAAGSSTAPPALIKGSSQLGPYFFHDNIDYVEFNPYWGIPRSILVNEMLPKLRRNPSYFDNLGYEVTDAYDLKFTEMNNALRSFRRSIVGAEAV